MLENKLNRRWLWFALTALLLANLMALLLVVLKMPLLPTAWNLSVIFPWALVFHVDLSIVVWALSMAGLLWLRYLPSVHEWIDRSATGLLWIAALGLVVTQVTGQGRPLLSNYIPVLDAPLYLASLGLFMAAVVMVATSRLCALGPRWRSLPLSLQALMLAVLALLVSTLVLLISGFELSGQRLDLQQAELLFWGVGHSLQAVYLLLLLAGWLLLLERDRVAVQWLQNPAVMTGLKTGLNLMLPVLLVPLLIALLWTPDQASYRHGFSLWMRVFSLPLLGVGLLLGWQVWRTRVEPLSLNGWRPQAVLLSILLLLLGAVLGSMIRADNLLVPAHYHATTGAVNLIFMALVYQQLEHVLRLVHIRRQLQLYAIGVVVLVAGLALSGSMGIGRKLSAAEQMLDVPAEVAAMLLMGCGGGIGLAASFWFVVLAMRAAMKGESDPLLRMKSGAVVDG